MGVHTITKGLDLPIDGVPAATVDPGAAVGRVALLGADHHGMKPKMLVAVGQRVLRGQPLFEDRKTEGVLFTAPATGTVEAIHRGDKRAFQSIVIALDDGDAAGEQVAFSAFKGGTVDALGGDDVRALLVESGLWAALRTRPYSRTPSPEGQPQSLFITATDSNPLAPDLDAVCAPRRDDLRAGLAGLRKLVQGKVYLCVGAGSSIDACGVTGIEVEQFGGKHPAGLVGTHIHLLAPAGREREQWHVGVQDVLAIGQLLRTGKLDVERVITVGGPAASKPRHLRTRLGADLDALLQGERKAGEVRTVSGSALGGRTSAGAQLGFLGRFHQQVTLLPEATERRFMGWLTAGADAFSSIRIYLSSLTPSKRFGFTTDTNGSDRAMVPIGMYERVMPLDILPTFLLRALIVGDLEQAEKLGALELDEEDLALCSFVCPGKIDHAAYLRDRLTQIQKEG